MRHASKLISAVTALLLLGGCQSLQTEMKNIGDRIGAVNWPHIQPRNQAEEDSVSSARLAGADTDNCPEITIVPDLSQIHQFAPNETPRLANKISELDMRGVESKCETRGNALSVDINLTFQGELGPYARQDSGPHSFSYPYFIAITAPSGEIIAKEIMSISADYAQGQTDTVETDTIRQLIPVQEGEALPSYEMMIGFQLTEAELAFNRALMAASLPRTMPGTMTSTMQTSPDEAIVSTGQAMFNLAEPAPIAAPLQDVEQSPAPAAVSRNDRRSDAAYNPYAPNTFELAPTALEPAPESRPVTEIEPVPLDIPFLPETKPNVPANFANPATEPPAQTDERSERARNALSVPRSPQNPPPAASNDGPAQSAQETGTNAPQQQNPRDITISDPVDTLIIP